MFERRKPHMWCAALMVCACAIISNASAGDETTAGEVLETEGCNMSATKPGNVTIVSAAFTVDRILSKFAESGVKVRARGCVAGQKIDSFIVRNISARDALEELVNKRGDWLLYEPVDKPGTFEIWDQASYKAEILPRMVRPKTFVLGEITAEEGFKAIKGVLTPNIGTAAFDPRTNKLFVTDLQPVLELIQRLIEQIDVAFITRVFYISYGDTESIGEKLAQLKGPAAPQPIVDERTRQIIVRDRLEKIRTMELLVKTLDIPATSGTAGNVLSSWKVSAIKPDAAVVEDLSEQDESGRPKQRVLKLNQPEAVLADGVGSTVTLTRLPDEKSGALVSFRVERGPAEVKLRVK